MLLRRMTAWIEADDDDDVRRRKDERSLRSKIPILIPESRR